MPRKTNRMTPPEANISLPQKVAALPKIERRLEELRAFEVDAVTERFSAEVHALENKLDKLLCDIFGNETAEYRRYRGTAHLDKAPKIMGSPLPINQVREGLEKGIKSAITQLESLEFR